METSDDTTINKRFIERRTEEDRQIDVIFVEQFAPQRRFNGKLSDLTDEFMIVILKKEVIQSIKQYMPKPLMVMFKFSTTLKITTSLSAIRELDDQDETQSTFRAIMYFDNMDAASLKTVQQIISRYGNPEGT